MPARMIRTTLTLPAELLAAVDEVVREGGARSRNEIVSLALQHELAARRRAEIDAAFGAMASDAEYQAEAQAIVREFARSDWESFQRGEQQHAGTADETR